MAKRTQKKQTKRTPIMNAKRLFEVAYKTVSGAAAGSLVKLVVAANIEEAVALTRSTFAVSRLVSVNEVQETIWA